MTFCNKDTKSWKADVEFVRSEISAARNTIKAETNDGVAKFTWDTNCYDVICWSHQEPKYAAYLAIAKNGSHTVTWYEIYNETHRW